MFIFPPHPKTKKVAWFSLWSSSVCCVLLFLRPFSVLRFQITYHLLFSYMPANATADVQSTDAKDVKAQAKPLNDAAKPFVPQAGAGRAAGRAADDRTCYTCGETGHVSHRCDEFQTKLCYYHSQERCRNTDDACRKSIIEAVES